MITVVGVQQQLPLPRGSLTYVSWNAQYRPTREWELRIWHRHEGDVGVCPSVDVYTDLVAAEMEEILEWLMESINDQWLLTGFVCRPLAGDSEKLSPAEPVVAAPVDVAPYGDLGERREDLPALDVDPLPGG